MESEAIVIFRIVIMVIVPALNSAFNNAIFATDPTSKLTVERVAAAVLARQDQIRSLFTESYQSTTENEISGTNRAVAIYTPDKMYLDYMHNTPPDRGAWLDPERFQLYLQADSGQSFKPFQRIYYSEVSEKSLAYWNSPYLQAIAWHPSNAYFADKTFDSFAGEFLAADRLETLDLLSESVDVDGLDCVWLATKSRSDEFWFAQELGYAIVQHVYRRGKHDEQQIDQLCSSFKDLGSGVWLPQRVQTDTYIRKGDQKLLTRSSTINVVQLAINDQVPADVFAIRLPSGTLTVRNGVVQGIEPQGEELLDMWSAWCLVELPRKLMPLHSTSVKTAMLGTFGLLGTVILIGCKLIPGVR